MISQDFKEKYEQVISRLDSGIAVHEMLYDKNGNPEDYRFIEFNDGFIKLTGLSRDVIGKTVLEVLPGTESYWIDTYAEVVIEGKTIQYSNYSKELKRWYEVTAFRNASNQFTTIIKDISERKRLEREIEIINERFNSVLNALKDGVWDFNPYTLEVMYFSPAWYTMLGYYPYELPQDFSTWKELLHPADKEVVFKINEYVARSREKTDIGSFSLDFRLRMKNGDYKWINGRGKVIEWDDNGNPVRLVGVHTDITEKKEFEHKLRKTRNFLREIIDSIPLALIVSNKEGDIIEINRKATVDLGVSGNAGNIFSHVDILKKNRDYISDLFRKGENHRFKTGFFDNGSEKFCDIHFYPMSNSSDNAIIIIEDITSKIRIEEMMIQTEKMMSVGGLAAGMAHEINNPLSGILQGIQNIERRLESNERNRKIAVETGLDIDRLQDYFRKRNIDKMMDGIRESGERAAEIVRDMLTFSRHSDTGKTETDLREIIEKSLKLAGNDYDIKKKYDFRKIRIIRSYETENTLALCLRNEVEQVILNILKNSAQAMFRENTSRPEIVLRLYNSDDYLILSIKDNGPGMPESVRKRVFEPFFTTKAPGEGTGLGLSVSYFIITENHDGLMEVESYPEKGTEIRIGFPVVRS